MVFQSYALFPHLTVAQNVAFGLEMRRVPKPEIAPRVAEALRLVRLGGLGERLPRQLSGGQQQRVALARALVIRPDVLLLDEPLSNLDAKLRETVRVEIRELQHKLCITTVMVTHDQEEALIMADRLVVMSDGAVRQVGTQRDLYERPADRFVAGFVGRSNLLPGTVVGPGRFETAGGRHHRLRRTARRAPASSRCGPSGWRSGPAAAGLDNRLSGHGRARLLSRLVDRRARARVERRPRRGQPAEPRGRAGCRRRATRSTWDGQPPPRSCWPTKAARQVGQQHRKGGAMSSKSMGPYISRRGVLKGAAAVAGVGALGAIPGLRPRPTRRSCCPPGAATTPSC